jgi:hypothetical protein
MCLVSRPSESFRPGVSITVTLLPSNHVIDFIDVVSVTLLAVEATLKALLSLSFKLPSLLAKELFPTPVEPIKQMVLPLLLRVVLIFVPFFLLHIDEHKSKGRDLKD